jgi:hypothetical protein
MFSWRLFPCTSGQLLAMLYLDLFLNGHYDRWTVSSEPLAIQALDKLRQGHFPGLLLMVIDLAELLRVEAELARHLDLRVGQVEFLPCIHPNLQMIGKTFSGHLSPQMISYKIEKRFDFLATFCNSALKAE